MLARALLPTVLTRRFPASLRPMWWFDDTCQRFQTVGGAGAFADVDPVGQLIDRSDYANVLTNTGTQRPLHKLAVQAGRNVLRFDGTNDWLVNTTPFGFTGETGYTVVLVASRSAAAGFAMMLVTCDSQNELRWDGAGTTPQFLATSHANSLGWSGTSTGWHLYAGRYHVATQAMGLSVDTGTEVTATATGAFASNCVSLGARPAGSVFFNGDIGAGILIPRYLTDAELSGLKAYFKDRWGTP